MLNATDRKYANSQPRLSSIPQAARRIAVVFLALFALAPSNTFAGETAKTVDSAADVLKHWTSDQHLYVKGDIRVNAASLDGLEKWLDAKGRNWTVVLMANASGEAWQDTRGVNYYGMDAVENALGRGLGNMREFAALKDKRTGQSNGAVFVLFLRERKFSYFGSQSSHSHRLKGCGC